MSNYTNAMIARMNATAPLNLGKAHDLASEFGVSYRSVIAKASQLGIAYEKKAPAAKRTAGVTKLAVANGIRAHLGLPEMESPNLTLAEMVEIVKALNAAWTPLLPLEGKK